jgi:3-isopropylmalate dehydrogenase
MQTASFTSEKPLKLAIIPGDGIGKEVTAEAVRVLEAVGRAFGRTIELEPLPWGADYFLQTGVTIPPNGYDMLREFDAIFIGALGDPRVPDNRHARDILLGTRFELDLYVNYRPVKLLHERLCPLKGRGPDDVNFVVFRENTEGLYVGVGGRFKPGTDDEIAIQEEINTYKGVHRIIRHAFEFAAARGLTTVCMADKSNAMTAGHALWQRVFRELAPQYPGIEATHYYIDALAMYMVLDPKQFQVIVTNNLFGDIITDLAATFQGGLGMAASGNIHPGKTSMFEPVHGSAPKFAGKNVANPIGAIASAALMLETLGLEAEALAVNQAIADAVNAGECTADVGGALGTREAGDAILQRVTRHGNRGSELSTHKGQTGGTETGRKPGAEKPPTR